MSVEVKFDLIKTVRRQCQANLDGTPPAELNKIEDAFDSNIQKAHTTSKTNAKWGWVYMGIVGACSAAFGLIGIYTESTAMKIYGIFSALMGMALTGLLGYATFSGKHPDIEDMEHILSKERVLYSTNSKSGERSVNVNLGNYAISKALEKMLKEKIITPIKSGKKEGTFLNLCGIKGVGKTYLSQCIAGEIAKETGKDVEVWELNTEKLGSSFGDEISGIPFLGTGATRAQKLQKFISYACLAVQQSKDSGGKPKKHIIIALDEIAKWLGAPEWGGAKHYNKSDASERSKICEELQKIMDKLKGEMGEGITLAFMSNASLETIADTIQDRIKMNGVNKMFVNPDEEVRKDYYQKVLNPLLKEKFKHALSLEQIEHLATIGHQSILTEVTQNHRIAYKAMKGYEQMNRDEFLTNYNHLSIRTIESVIKTVIDNFSGTTNFDDIYIELQKRLQNELRESISQSNWKGEIAQKDNFEMSNYSW